MTIVRVEPVGDAAVSRETIGRIARLLDADGVIACPTETVYGLSADYLSAGAATRIRALKGCAEARPFLLLLPGRAWLDRFVRPGPWTRPTERLVEAFWPGPLTLVLPAVPGLPDHLTGPGGTVALRESPDRFVRALFGARPRPLLSTSANPAGRPPARDLAALRGYFDTTSERIDAAVDNGPREGCPSSLVSLTGGEIRILRAGPVGRAEIEAASRS